MHAAPPVRIETAPDRAWRCFVSASAGAAAASLVAWVAMLRGMTGTDAAWLAMLAAASVAPVAWWAGRRRESRAGALVWDGAAWAWAPERGEAATGELRVMIDLGAWMLLRFAPAGARHGALWRAASRRQAPALWPAWRAALHARRPTAEPGAATDAA
jgi:hypothetical protein